MFNVKKKKILPQLVDCHKDEIFATQYKTNNYNKCDFSHGSYNISVHSTQMCCNGQFIARGHEKETLHRKGAIKKHVCISKVHTLVILLTELNMKTVK